MNSCKLYMDYGIKFDRTQYDIENILKLDTHTFLSYSTHNS